MNSLKKFCKNKNYNKPKRWNKIYNDTVMVLNIMSLNYYWDVIMFYVYIIITYTRIY